MITGENDESRNEYERAKEDRLRQEKELVHREIHPLFHKTEEELREYDNKASKEAEEQQEWKLRELAGWNTPLVEREEGNEGGSYDSEVVVVFGSAKKGGSNFSREKIQERKNMEDGVRKVLIRCRVW